MAVEQLSNFEDLRSVVRSPEYQGIIHGGWSAFGNQPLHPFLNEIADDIQAWLRPEQGWSLAHLNFGMINLQRIAQSSEGQRRLVAKMSEPYKIVPVLHFDATNPPLKRGFLGRGKPQLDVAKVFQPRFFSNRVYMEDTTHAVIYLPNDTRDAVNIGAVFTLARALKNMDCPYYLGGVTVSANRRYE